MIKRLPVNVFSALLTLLATVAFFFWVFKDDEAAGYQPSTREEAAPAWYWTNARFWNFNDEGSLEQEATATGVEHFSEEDVTFLGEPRVVSHLDEGAPWHTRAERGEVRENNDVIELSGKVEIRKADNSLNMRTERLILDRGRELAETDMAVTITGEQGRTDAVGMRAWLKQEKVELLSKVKSVYEPNQGE